MLVKKLMALGGYTKAEDLERDYPTMESYVEAFPQAQVLINQYKKQNGGSQSDPLMQVIQAVSQQLGIEPEKLVSVLQQSPDFLTQLSQIAAQDPNQAATVLLQTIQGAMAQGQGQPQSEMAQPGQMPVNPQEAMMAAYGGSKLSKFTRNSDLEAFPQAVRMYPNAAGFRKHQVPPGETGQLYTGPDDPNVVMLPAAEVSAQAYRPPMLMPPQRQQAGFFPEISSEGFWKTLGAAGALGALGRYAYNDLKLDVKEDAFNNRYKAESPRKASTRDWDKVYIEISNKVGKMELDRYNKENNTKFPTLYEKGIPKEVQTRHQNNTAILYNLKKQNPEQYSKAYKILAMYPNIDLKDAVGKYKERSLYSKAKGRVASKYRRQGTAGKVGMGLAGFIGGPLATYTIGQGILNLYNKYIASPDDLTDEEQEILQSASSSGAINTESQGSSNNEIDYGALLEYIKQTESDDGLSDFDKGTSTDDGTVIVTEEKYGGVTPYAYGGMTYGQGGMGGGNPYGYGYYPPPMAEGGDVAMPGVDNVDSEVEKRKNALFNFVRNNITQSQMPESFRKGGAKKKKG